MGYPDLSILPLRLPPSYRGLDAMERHKNFSDSRQIHRETSTAICFENGGIYAMLAS